MTRSLLVASSLAIGLAIAREDVRAQTMNGVWATEGYGMIAEITGDTALQVFEVTRISCIRAFDARSTPAPTGAVAAYRLTQAPLTFVVLADGKPNRARLHQNGAASDLVIQRIPQKPATCDRPPANTPLSNFDVFAATWAEQYGFFDLKHADWAKVVETNRAKVSDQTAPAELFDILSGMIATFEDAHTSIGAPEIKKGFNGYRGGSRLNAADRGRAFALAERYLQAPIHKFCEGQLEFGMLPNAIGYVRLRSFSRYHADGSFESGLTALEAALDTIFTGADQWKGLVVDVRINGGGADPYGLAIASRLATRPYEAYSKQARLDPTDPTKWTAAQPSLVKPSARPGFRGPVVELIGRHSVSAAETFTQALLGRRPKIVRVGDNTQGVFSDVLGRQLPNGWRFGLPNEKFVTDGKNFDGPGIPPDVAVPPLTADELGGTVDRALERAIAIVGGKTG